MYTCIYMKHATTSSVSPRCELILFAALALLQVQWWLLCNRLAPPASATALSPACSPPAPRRRPKPAQLCASEPQLGIDIIISHRFLCGWRLCGHFLKFLLFYFATPEILWRATTQSLLLLPKMILCCVVMYMYVSF